jgi:hypothetical protein
MIYSNRKRKVLRDLAAIATFCIVFVFAGSSVTHAQNDPAYIGLVRIFDPEFTLPHAFGLAYSPLGDFFLALAGDSAEQPGGGLANLTMISPFEELVGSANLPAIANPINLAFDSKANRLLLFDTASQELIAIGADSDGYVDPAEMTRFAAEQYGVLNPLGMSVDPQLGTLFILSGADARIVRIEPDAQGGFDGAAALAEGRISQIDLGGLGLGALQGLAFNPADGHLYVLNPAERKLVEVSQAGQLLAARDMSGLELQFRDPQGIVFAPSADLTDDPAQMHLFLMDSGLAPLSPDPFEADRLYLPLLVRPVQEAGSAAVHPPALGLYETGQEVLGPARIIEFTLTRPGLVAQRHQDATPGCYSLPKKR